MSETTYENSDAASCMKKSPLLSISVRRAKGCALSESDDNVPPTVFVEMACQRVKTLEGEH